MAVEAHGASRPRSRSVGGMKYRGGLWLAFTLATSGCAPMAAGMQGFSNGYNGGRQPATQTQSDSQTCTSDYLCPYGSQCVKHQYQSTGYCAQSTNRYGTPTYAPPRNDSVMPGNPHQCQFDTDCGPGWRCDKGSGIYGSCVR